MSDLIKRSQIYRALNRQAATIVHNGETYIRKDAALELVRIGPRVEATTVVHGRWESDMYFDEPVMRCTVCKRGFAAGHKAERFQYCPNCGAKMDAKDIDVPTKDGGETHDSQGA